MSLNRSSMRIFLIVLLNFHSLSSPIMYKSGDSATGPDWTITNSPISYISGNTAYPFQFVDILNNESGLFKMSYSFPNGPFPQVSHHIIQGQAKTVIKQTLTEDCRVDAYEDFTVDLTVNQTNGIFLLILGNLTS
jgi:hypothetical protein